MGAAVHTGAAVQTEAGVRPRNAIRLIVQRRGRARGPARAAPRIADARIGSTARPAVARLAACTYL
jgi:hypothetical protein